MKGIATTYTYGYAIKRGPMGWFCKPLVEDTNADWMAKYKNTARPGGYEGRKEYRWGSFSLNGGT